MAIHWFDPTENYNGNGTYASPYNGSDTNGVTAVSGDEYRIKSVHIGNFVGTEKYYCRNYNNNYTMEFVTGHSSGTLQPLEGAIEKGDILMHIATKTCSRVHGVTISGGRITRWNTAMIHGFNWDWKATSDVFHEYRVVKREYQRNHYNKYEFCITGKYQGNTSGTLTVTDGWYGEYSRAGTNDLNYFTLMAVDQINGMSNNALLQIGGVFEGTTYDLQHTIVCAYSSGFAAINFKNGTYATNFTLNFHQITCAYYYPLIYGTPSYGGTGNTFNLKYWGGYYGPLGSNSPPYQMDDNLINIENTCMQYPYMRVGGGDTVRNSKMVLKEIYLWSVNSSMWSQSFGGPFQLEMTGNIFISHTSSLNYITYGLSNLKLGPNFRIWRYMAGTTGYVNGTEDNTLTALAQPLKYGRFPTTLDYENTSILDNIANDSNYVTSSALLHLPTGWSTSDGVGSREEGRVAIRDVEYIFDSRKVVFYTSQSMPGGLSLWLKDVNPNDPWEREYLTPFAPANTSNATLVDKNFDVYKNNAPSLSFSLTHWANTNHRTVVKAINLPVSGGTAKTVSGFLMNAYQEGYSYSDAFTNSMSSIHSLPVGVTVRVLYNDGATAEELLSVGNGKLSEPGPYDSNFTWSGTWDAFSVSFTPSYTQVAQVQIRIVWSSRGRLFLSDLQVA
jgi:hypothetical protein